MHLSNRQAYERQEVQSGTDIGERKHDALGYSGGRNTRWCVYIAKHCSEIYIEALAVLSSFPTDTNTTNTAENKPKKHKDWDGITSEILSKDKTKTTTEDPNAGGDIATNEFFQQLYTNADDDTRRAIIKSYQESNGTVLSTNWSEVGKGKVETKPPTGQEAKKW